MTKFFIAFLLLFSYFAFSQVEENRKCAFSEYNKGIYGSNFEHKFSTVRKNLRVSSDEIITIPVVVHILYNTPSQNLSDEQIHSQIAVLNEDFRRQNKDTIYSDNTFNNSFSDCRIEFKLAQIDPYGCTTNGITRRKVIEPEFVMIAEDSKIKSYDYWPSDSYLNIWVCPLNGNNLGSALFPEGTNELGIDNTYISNAKNDGVVITYRAFGRIKTISQNFNLGRTATHEIGHWLGLLHTWGDVDCNNEITCSCGTDYVDDTPFTHSSNNSCDVKFSNCGGINHKVMIENFMDYTFDRCMHSFTKEQKNRMRNAFYSSPRRSALLKSNALNISGKYCGPDYLTIKIINPLNSIVNLSISTNLDYRLKTYIFDSFGNLISKIDINGTGDGVHSLIKDKNLSSGLYYITVYDKDENLINTFKTVIY